MGRVEDERSLSVESLLTEGSPGEGDLLSREGTFRCVVSDSLKSSISTVITPGPLSPGLVSTTREY